ncbi:MAG: redox-regulated ATPase YchF, partial [Candidatus Diapherotrites archaeon]|nr:redox-regulated ATPase YchF [Candidatus Diapherotrites archaeon]
MELGIVGAPNCGKTTLLAAATLAEVEIANYPFTTIKPNIAVAYARSPDPSKELGVTPNPNNSIVKDGIRFLPLKVLDVAGLVPGAHEGKGLGLQFLNDLSAASALIHVVDMSGQTDDEGNQTKDHDPANTIRFLEEELHYWLLSILEKTWPRLVNQVKMSGTKVEELIQKQLSSFKLTEADVTKAILGAKLDKNQVEKWGTKELLQLVTQIQKESKPILIAANKMDLPKSKENLERCEKEFPTYLFIPTCAEAELALRRADNAGMIKYTPGSKTFEIVKTDLPEKQKQGLEYIQTNVLNVFGSTGVQNVLDKAVFELLKLIAVYPVEDENKFTDKQNRVLPDAFLLKPKAKVIDLAFKIHTSIGENFVAAINAKTKRRLGKDTALK